ncbi:MAG: signal peptidase I [Candidatus Omnitrophota bacterium]
MKIELVLAFFVRNFIFAAFKIKTVSMKHTLIVGDKIFVNKFIYRFKPPKRGDIIVFKYPLEPKKDYVKRLIAFGGETVQIKDGKILINGVPVDDPKISSRRYYNRGPYGEEDQNISVPADSLYALGDNSANSRDSREWGFVPKKNLVGKAFIIWWPLKRIGLTE